MYMCYKIYLQWVYWTLFFLSHVVSKIFAKCPPPPELPSLSTIEVSDQGGDMKILGLHASVVFLYFEM